MKKISVLVLFSVVMMSSFAQTKKTTTAEKKPAAAKTSSTAKATSTPNPAMMKNALDSFSYAVGVSIANFYREQGVQNINNDMVVRALLDAQNGKAKLDEAAINNCIVSFMQNVRSEKASVVRKEGEVFLEENKSKPGVVTLPSGLQYKIIKEGSGAKPTMSDRVKVHYHGTLIDGTIFDSSVQRGEPLDINLNGVIAGWVEALQLMPVGSKWTLYIPSTLGYGDSPAGAIKPGSALIFDVELLEIIK